MQVGPLNGSRNTGALSIAGYLDDQKDRQKDVVETATFFLTSVMTLFCFRGGEKLVYIVPIAFLISTCMDS